MIDVNLIQNVDHLMQAKKNFPGLVEDNNS